MHIEYIAETNSNKKVELAAQPRALYASICRALSHVVALTFDPFKGRFVALEFYTL